MSAQPKLTGKDQSTNLPDKGSNTLATKSSTRESPMTRSKRKKSATPFRPGTSKACEALLYVFTGYCGTEMPEEPIVERIAAPSIEEGLVYLRRWRPDFEVTSVRYIGLITLLSGSPLD